MLPKRFFKTWKEIRCRSILEGKKSKSGRSWPENWALCTLGITAAKKIDIITYPPKKEKLSDSAKSISLIISGTSEIIFTKLERSKFIFKYHLTPIL